MSRFLPLLLAAVALPVAGQGTRPKGTKVALLVGITAYDHGKLDPLKYTENDVDELAKVLQDKRSGFAVTLLTTARGKDNAAGRPTGKNIRAALKALLRDRKRDDTVLVALAGHGVQLKVKGKDEAFFCPSDAQLNDADRLISLKSLVEELDDSGAGVKLVLVDACRNDPKEARSLDVDAVPRPPRGTAVLFSCASGQRAFETAKLGKGHGVFFYHVLQGLKGEAKNKKGQVTWNRLVDYVTTEVPEVVPKLIGAGAQQSPHNLTNIVGASPVLLGGTVAPVDPVGGPDAVTVKDARYVKTLLSSKSVQKELKVTDDQAGRIEAARQEYSVTLMKHRRSKDRTPVQAATKKFGEVAATMVQKEFTPSQTRRLGQLHLQYEALQAPDKTFEKAEVKNVLKLTHDQKVRVQAIAKEVEDDSKKIPRTGGTRASFQEIVVQTIRLRREGMAKILTTFTDEQKSAWRRLTGEPFEFKLDFFGFGGAGFGRPKDKGK